MGGRGLHGLVLIALGRIKSLTHDKRERSMSPLEVRRPQRELQLPRMGDHGDCSYDDV